MLLEVPTSIVYEIMKKAGATRGSISLQPRLLRNNQLEKLITSKNKINRVKGIKIEQVSKRVLEVILQHNKKELKAHIIMLKPVKGGTAGNSVQPVLAITSGKRDDRERVFRVLAKLGLRRGWLRQRIVKSFDNLITSLGLSFELQSLVYELRMYTEPHSGRQSRVFIAAGTANFWPKGVASISEALEEYLLPIEKARGYYIFIKSLRFRVLREGKPLGLYSVDRWGKVTLARKADIGVAIDMIKEIIGQVVKSYLEYTVGYHVGIGRSKGATAYILEEAKSIYLEAVEPGPGFFETVKLYLAKPGIWENKLIILPIEVGNPRIVSRVIERRSGAAVTLIATYQGIRLVPAPGSYKVDAEIVDAILSMFRSLLSEEIVQSKDVWSPL